MAVKQSNHAPRPCLHCGGSFVPTNKRGRPSKHCSKECKSDALAFSITPRELKPCATCWRQFVGTPCQHYCSPRCRVRRRKWSRCEGCRLEFQVSSNSAGRYCRSCRIRLKQQTELSKLEAEGPRTCAECGGSFRARHHSQTFCSRRCANRLYTRAKRIRHAAAMVDEGITIGRVYERSNGVCALCRRPVDASLVPPDAQSATIDHVQPLSKGGLHSWQNVQLAHYGCNSRKHNRTE